MYDYELKRSNRKTISIRITKDCRVVVGAPFFVTQNKIDSFVNEHTSWIEKNLKIQQERAKNSPSELTKDEIVKLKNDAKNYIVPKVEEYASIMGLEYGDIKITSAKTRFGSCNTVTHNLCFSYHLITKPAEAVDYVIVHELAHIVYPDHSKNFYNYIEKFMPDYKNRIKILKSNERGI